MKYLLLSLTVTWTAAYSLYSSACSFAPGYDTGAPPLAWIDEPTEKPEKPDVTVESLKRGNDDGNYASCSDAGILTIAINGTPYQSYFIEIVKGEFPDTVIPDHYISPITLKGGKAGFYFVWLDLPAGKQQTKPIDVTLSVKQVSLRGIESEATMLHVTHDGTSQ